ncbi:tRNA (adenosine(37)-N6)-threonylcarbamoyltransferase complex transferase subunit TsaD [candidate division KSB1 bacterium]|nr:tRNA (adenosine(37)-N6)-threonylcarbamoyltransferase complex transferase subunit TsaD [candidate division KSB1 bacterium]
MIVLGIESSCDETSAAVVRDDHLLSNIIASQEVHREFGGVVPELASRAHARHIVPIVKQALRQANVTINEIDGIAVTYGPGLVGSLLVGLNFAKALAFTHSIPFVGVNHIEGHIWANFIDVSEPQPPFIALIISGGHTQLVIVEAWGTYRTIGKTKDDAAGEAFDKVAKMMNLGYPGGPVIDRMAKNANSQFVRFPRAMMTDGNYDFSFSGLKTAVLYYLREHGPENHQADVVASFQAALSDVLIEKTIQAAKAHRLSSIVLAGGVACNSYIRNNFQVRATDEKLNVYLPKPILCTDNAAMIARAGLLKLNQGEVSGYDLAPKPSLRL